MPLILNWGTPVDAAKAGRLAALLSEATGVGFVVRTEGLLSRTFKLVSAGTVQTNYGAMTLEAKQGDGGSMEIPDVIIARIAPPNVAAFKNGLRDQGVVLYNLVEKPQEWFTSPNFSGGYRRNRKTQRKRNSRKTQRRRRN